MPKRQKKLYPCDEDPDHIFNLLIDNEVHCVNMGWRKLEFELHSNIKNTDGKDLLGQCVFDENRILLEVGMTDLVARETILHECIHCFLELAAYDETLDDSSHLTLTNERLTDLTTKAITFLFKLNPKLMELLLYV